jgi:two-component system, sensor histidine kinase and response regulator
MLPNERTTRNEVAATPGEVEGLVVATDRTTARPLVDFLRTEGINVQVVNSADAGFEEALLHRPNVVVIDEHISNAGGVDLCERLKSNTRTHFLPIILFAHNKENELLRLDALAAGADAMFSPATSKEERRARLWALLRSQAIFRKLDGRRQAQSSAITEKRRWVRGLIHDIQNLLGAIQANFEYIAQCSSERDGFRRGDFDECVEETRGTFREMVRNLRTVLEFERFEAGDVVLKSGKVLLSEVCDTVCSSLAHMASSEGKRLIVDSGAFSLPINGDANYMKEAVALLATYVLRQAENQTCFLHLSSETGVVRMRIYGDKHQIPEASRKNLFDPYSDSVKERSTSVTHKAGLALARVIVQVHHGSTWVEDTPGAGSAFVIEFPSHWALKEHRSPE